ncbi:MAG: tRNA threonylcarbamoyladenosine biosynthesis protein TsaE [Alphaproteobacteria bacterium MarineAlpha5_Bin9]|nr:MAG: tRNA threonylcarbamoyladenosine biosynthesis protein TsaE [Alphaproteobacteria bacterium MarineAlpha5_Bin9]
MKNNTSFKFNLKKLENFSISLSKRLKKSDVILLEGDLGSGKTTFTRFLINSLFKINKLKKPKTIQSPTFPLLINYNLGIIEILHYDLFRITTKKELNELGLFENIEGNISIIEWPKMLKKNIKEYYFIKFSLIDTESRKLQISHSSKNIKF